VAEVSARLGVSQHSLYAWMKHYGMPETGQGASRNRAELRRFKAELKRVTEERNIPKKTATHVASESQ
jgi:transposase